MQRLVRSCFFWVPILALFLVSTRGYGFAQNDIPDFNLANEIWGNPQNYGQSPSPAATYFANPLAIGMGARPLGMGEAFTAIADEESAVWWNPAGLTQMDTNEVHWMGGDRVMVDAPFSGFASASYMLDNRMVFALSYERPYHPIGRYPNVLGGSYNFSSQVWSGAGPVVIPGGGGSSVPFTSITDSQVQDFLAEAYRYWINPPFQEDDYVLTFATPLSADENFAFGINVKYIKNDPDYVYLSNNSLLNNVSGWGADLGFLYKVPIMNYGHTLSFGLDLRDVASQVKFDDGREITIPPVSTLGVGWSTRDFFHHSRLNMDADFSYINDPGLDPSDNHRLNLGAEMWFFHDHIGPRAGYSFLFDQPNRATVGISFKYLISLDYAYQFPEFNEQTGSHWFSVVFHWGGPKRSIPLPDVSATVDPPIFAPRNGEVATFALAAKSKNGIARWTLNILNSNNEVVKTYQDMGTPPDQIIWGGEDKTYRPLPDGDYTFLFTATDNLGASSSTPVQTLKIYTPPVQPVQAQDIQALLALIKKQQTDEEAGDQQALALARTGLRAATQNQTLFNNLPAVSKAPVAPALVTPAAQAAAAAGSFSYPNTNEVPFPQTTIATEPNGQRSFQVDYVTGQTMPRYILGDIADIVRTSAQDAGNSVNDYDVRARYGNRVFRLVAPSDVAVNYSRGFITENQFFNGSAVTLDGNPISPNY